jgi:hypothetical protein
MRIQARDAFIGLPVETGVWLTHPDGHTEHYPFGPGRDVALELLPRGDYVATMEARGLVFPQPIALSKDQDVVLKVLTDLDVAGAGLLLVALGAGLLLFGRPRILFLLRPVTAHLARPAGALVALAAVVLGRGPSD